MSIWPIAIAAALGYALGCAPVADLIARRHGVGELRAVGDRNPGYWNARDRIGVRAALPILLLDTAKGFAAAALGLAIAGLAGAIAGWAAAIVGHMFPAPRRFRGGRGVLCLVGGAIAVVPLACIPAAVALLAVRWRWGFARGAQAALVAAPFCVAVLYGPGPELAATVGLLVLVGVRAALADRALRRAGIDKRAG